MFLVYHAVLVSEFISQSKNHSMKLIFQFVLPFAGKGTMREERKFFCDPQVPQQGRPLCN